MERVLRCAREHAFDIARSGYCNLLQPQDRRSREPGDSREAVAARRRLYDRGFGAELHSALTPWLALVPSHQPIRVLDLGCGEGSVLGMLAGSAALIGHGIDLSSYAVDLAARRYPDLTWLVVNADRRLPYADGSFDVVLSITANLPFPEAARVLAPQGELWVARPASDDLAELREAIQGRADSKDRLAAALERSAGLFSLVEQRAVRRREEMSREVLEDLLRATYRGGRRREQERLLDLGALAVTLAVDLARLRLQ
jgi:23S rRNA (guanine745-N1)-methyltransferase